MTKPTAARTVLSASAALVGGALAAAAVPLAIANLWGAVRYGRLSQADVAVAVLFALGLLWLGWWMYRRAVRTARAWTSEHGPAKLPRFAARAVTFLAVWPVVLTVLLSNASESAHGPGPIGYLLILGTPLMAIAGGLLGLGHWMLCRGDA